ncbi:hypothetical protein DR999_PMT05090 [Platysternon megacephalum]|uniref:Uncharacterized protein n=1 Tax=Platysternon megacephalum TaxID=55544 RepID=A0A4D9EX48_9SAUR|nr:hypothetical protein DR999_PMT05090 [Platysternon megacephalum]
MRALRLAPCFTREALAAYLAFGDEQVRHSDMVQAAILDQVGLSMEKYSQNFSATRLALCICPEINKLGYALVTARYRNCGGDGACDSGTATESP